MGFKAVSIPGVKFWVTAPQSYTMNYFNGSYTYNEKFAVLQISSEYSQGGSAAADYIIAQVDGALAAAGPATEGVSLALLPLADAAMQWLKSMLFNADGSVTLMFAHHYCGTVKGGIDPTFVPGGLDSEFWTELVDNLSSAIGIIGGSTLKIEQLELQEVLKLPDNLNTSGERAIRKN